jgi:hypothetical protein
MAATLVDDASEIADEAAIVALLAQQLPLPLLDLRSRESFAAGHIRGATWLSPADLSATGDCIDGGAHLPPTGTTLWLFGADEALLAAVAEHLTFGYTIARCLSLVRSSFPFFRWLSHR